MENCPNCNSEIGTRGIFLSNLLATDDKINFINKFTDKNEKAYCSKCEQELIDLALKNYKSIKKEIKQAYTNYINSFPVLTIENPQGWEYKIIGLVSQSASIVANSANFTKIQKETILKLKIKTYELGANAIIGARISYSFKGLGTYDRYKFLNTYGTAIKVLNTDQFPESYHQSKEVYASFEESSQLVEKFEWI